MPATDGDAESFDRVQVLSAIQEFEDTLNLRAKSCGPDSVRLLCHLLGRECSTEAFSLAMSESGIEIGKLIEISKNACNLNMVAVKFDDIDDVPIPSILVLDRSHCLVVLEKTANGMVVFDSHYLNRRMMTPEDESSWDGTTLVVAAEKSVVMYKTILASLIGVSTLAGYIAGRKKRVAISSSGND